MRGGVVGGQEMNEILHVTVEVYRVVCFAYMASGGSQPRLYLSPLEDEATERLTMCTAFFYNTTALFRILVYPRVKLQYGSNPAEDGIQRCLDHGSALLGTASKRPRRVTDTTRETAGAGPRIYQHP